MLFTETIANLAYYSC